MKQLDTETAEEASEQPIRIIRRFGGSRYFGWTKNGFFFKDYQSLHRVIPEAYHLSFIEFPFWATIRFEIDLAKNSFSEKPRRDCIHSLMILAEQEAKKVVRNDEKRPASLFSFFRANEFGSDPKKKEVHTHLLIRPHAEWSDIDLAQLMNSFGNKQLSRCGIATFDFSRNSDSLARVAYVCKLKGNETEKKIDYSKGFNRWLKRHLPLHDCVQSSLNTDLSLKMAA